MKREEAIRRMECCRNFLANNYSDMGEPNFTAFNMAIEALEQNEQAAEWYKTFVEKFDSCEDCISRQAVLDRKYVVEVKNMWHMTEKIEVVDVDDIKALPSVNPQTKTGHWILAGIQSEEDIDNDNYRYICSECQHSDIHAKDIEVPYCWNCGAKMEGEEKE